MKRKYASLDRKKCPICNSYFEPYRPYQKYCCNDCRLGAYKIIYKYKIKETVLKTCKQCGKEFLTNNKNKIYCSNACMTEYQNNFYKKKEKKKRKCLICGKEFLSTHHAKKYCCHECYIVAAEKRRNGN